MSAIQMRCDKCGGQYLAGVVGSTPWPAHECPVLMPDSSDSILTRLRDRSHLEDCGEYGLECVVYIEQAEVAVRDTRDATVKEIVDALRLASVVTGPDTAADFIARRFPNGGTHDGS